ncbi:ATP-binding cassette domain-containing protein [Glutamicibacter sp. MNS18]|nr:ATP-binding cassette domain-containing protein [Glutamicibacter sp. MNS18]
MEYAIEVRGLRKSFGTQQVLHAVDFHVKPTQIFALLGSNGAGKTTIIKILSTLLAADGGTARVAGAEVGREPERVRRAISLTGQSSAVDEALTGEENLVMFGRLRGLGKLAAQRRAAELLEEFELQDAARKPLRSYSGGMRRRLDLALSLVLRPELLFLDEPTTGLDPHSRRRLWKIIEQLSRDGTTVLLTTQYLDEADHLADHIAVLHEGRIAAHGSAAQLKSALTGQSVQLHDDAGGLRAQHATDGSLRGLRDALDGFLGQGLEGTVALYSPTLDDVYFEITSRSNTVTGQGEQR